MFEKYFQSVKFLESIFNLPLSQDYMNSKERGIFYLQRSQDLVKRLKIDLNQFKFINIAGTSGKGSTTAMVHQILYAAGKKVGSYYSPHPTTSIERIKVNNQLIDPVSFSFLLEKIKPHLEGMLTNGKYGQPSYFEIFFALALLYFQQQKCEYVVLETGCGGEFDATNIISRPLIVAITNVGLDHVDLLGKTLSKIARTKAGIVKPKSVFVTTEKRPHLLKIFKAVAEQKMAKFLQANGQQFSKQKNKFLQANGQQFLKQKTNALLAARICQELNIADKCIDQGIKSMKLSCRFEPIQSEPLVILDGAHNTDKIKSTVENLSSLKFKKLRCIFTLPQHKDAEAVVVQLAPVIDQVLITRHLTADRKCADLKMLCNLFLKYNKKIQVKIFIDPWQALDSALKGAGKEDLILVTGSFYLAGELRKRWVSEEKILKTRRSI